MNEKIKKLPFVLGIFAGVLGILLCVASVFYIIGNNAGLGLGVPVTQILNWTVIKPLLVFICIALSGVFFIVFSIKSFLITKKSSEDLKQKKFRKIFILNIINLIFVVLAFGHIGYLYGALFVNTMPISQFLPLVCTALLTIGSLVLNVIHLNIYKIKKVRVPKVKKIKASK